MKLADLRPSAVLVSQKAAAVVAVDHRGVNEVGLHPDLNIDAWTQVRTVIREPGHTTSWREPRCLFELLAADGTPVFSGVMAGRHNDDVTNRLIEHGNAYGAPTLILHDLGEWPRHDCCVAVPKPGRNGEAPSYQIHSRPVCPDSKIPAEYNESRIFGAAPGAKYFL